MKFWQIPWFSAKISFRHSHVIPINCSHQTGEQIPAGLSSTDFHLRIPA
ncbi:MAG: hypothetical protein GY795_20475 [Desulfobacterales bacterium]|nr:hypothetical protein [Desulfobacterales bacterium]